jgi:plasmid maintenance system antidote protein VapI
VLFDHRLRVGDVMAETQSIGEVLRGAIKASGRSANEIAKATDVPQPCTIRFIGEADIRISTAERIASYFGFELIQSKRSRNK